MVNHVIDISLYNFINLRYKFLNFVILSVTKQNLAGLADLAGRQDWQVCRAGLAQAADLAHGDMVTGW